MKVLTSILILLGLASFQTASAQLKVVQNEGHKLMISASVFSEDDKTLYTGGWDGKIKVWDRESFKEIKTLVGHTGKVSELIVVKDKLISIGSYEMNIWNLEKESKTTLNFADIAVGGWIHKTSIYAAGQKGLYQYTLSYGRYLSKQIFIPKYSLVDAIQRDSTSAWLAYERSLVLVDFKKGSVIQEIRLPRIDMIQEISLSHDKSKFICSGMNQIYVYDNETLEYQGLVGKAHNSGAIADGELFGVQYNKIDVVSFNLIEDVISDRFEKSEMSVRHLKLSNDGNYLLGYNYSTMILWDVKTKSKLHEFRRSKLAVAGISINQNSFSCGVGSQGESRLFNLKTLQFEVKQKNHFQTVAASLLGDKNYWEFCDDNVAFKIDKNSGYIIDSFNIEKPGQKLPVRKMKSAMEMLSEGLFDEHVHKAIETEKKIVFQLNNDIKVYDKKKRQYKILKKHQDYVKDISLLPNNEYFLSAGLDKMVYLWDLKKGKVALEMKGHSDRVFAVEALNHSYFISGSANGELVEWINHKNTYYNQIDKLNGAIYDIASNDKYFVVGHESGIALYSSESYKKIKDVLNGITPIKFVEFINEELFMSKDANEKIQIWSLKKGLLANLIITKTGSVVYTEDGYYYGDKKSARESIHFKNGNQVYLFEQFDLKFNRPDIIAERIGLADQKLIDVYHSAYLKRLKILGFTEDDITKDLSIPILEINEEIESVTQADFLKISLSAEDKNNPLTQLNIWINDVPIYGSEGIKIDGKQKQFVFNDFIELVNGKNKIQFSVTNDKGLESLKLSRFVLKEGDIDKPELYLICIGASEYEASDFNLTYAAKDAKDIQQLFESKEAPYSKVHSTILQNEEVTKENLLNLKTELKSAKINDQVLIFIAGHGVLDANLDYYFATSDMDFTNPSEKGMPYEALESLLDGIKPLKKTIFIDACHSGEIDKDEIALAQNISTSENEDVQFRSVGSKVVKQLNTENTFELTKSLFSDLRRGTGSTIISSAGGMEFAMEGDDWSNGLFTYCLLNGIKSNKADLNQDGEIWLSEIQQYVGKEVALLSGGLQQPTSRIENQTVDFRLW